MTPPLDPPLEDAAVGLISSLEVHQQLLTEKKLFCQCPAGRYTRTHDGTVLRHMRPTLSELGVYDATALMEFKTRKHIVYLLSRENTCTYEIGRHAYDVCYCMASQRDLGELLKHCKQKGIKADMKYLELIRNSNLANIDMLKAIFARKVSEFVDEGLSSADALKKLDEYHKKVIPG